MRGVTRLLNCYKRADFHEKGQIFKKKRHVGPTKGHGGPKQGQGGPPFETCLATSL